MAGRTWSRDELTRLAELTQQYVAAPEAAHILNSEFHGGVFVRSLASVKMTRQNFAWRVGQPCPVPERLRVDLPPTARATIRPPRPEAPEADPLEWVERFRPVALPAPQRPRASVTPTNGLTLVAGDMHFGTHDDRALSIFVEACRQLKPARVILNGDLPDLLAVSKYPKDARPKHTWSLRDEAAAMATFLRELESAVPRETVIVETEANHSGNGTASRWWRYLSENVPALMTHPRAEELLSYQAWWYPEWSRLRIEEDVLIAGELLVMHGEIVRKHGAYSARAHSEKYAASVMHSHTHRVGMVAQRIPGLRGGRGEGVQRSYEIGCLCSLEPVYAKGVNWTQGFAIVHEGDTDGDYAADLITIAEGRAVVGALGATLRAA